jgi:hypothetical protein
MSGSKTPLKYFLRSGPPVAGHGPEDFGVSFLSTLL